MKTSVKELETDVETGQFVAVCCPRTFGWDPCQAQAEFAKQGATRLTRCSLFNLSERLLTGREFTLKTAVVHSKVHSHVVNIWTQRPNAMQLLILLGRLDRRFCSASCSTFEVQRWTSDVSEPKASQCPARLLTMFRLKISRLS